MGITGGNTIGATEGNTTFRSTAVKPYLTLTGEPDDIEPGTENTEKVLGTPQAIIPQDTIALEQPTQPAIERPATGQPATEQPTRPATQQSTQPATEHFTQPVTEQPVKRKRGRPRKHPVDANIADITVFLQNTQDDHQFSASRQSEISGLLEKRVFEIVPISDVPANLQNEST